MIIIRAVGHAKPARPLLDQFAALEGVLHAEKMYRELLAPMQFKPFTLTTASNTQLVGEMFWLWKNYVVVHAGAQRWLCAAYASGPEIVLELQGRSAFRGRLAGGGRRPRLPKHRP